MKTKEVSMNDTVYVKFTEEGLKIHKQIHDDFNRLAGMRLTYKPPRLNKAGLHRTQLWSLFHDFGPYVQIGSNIPFTIHIK